MLHKKLSGTNYYFPETLQFVTQKHVLELCVGLTGRRWVLIQTASLSMVVTLSTA